MRCARRAATSASSSTRPPRDDVHQKRRRLHQIELTRADDVLCFVGLRCAQHHEVGAGEQVVTVGPGHREPLLDRLRQPGALGVQQVHAEGTRPLRGLGPDLAEADDAERQAVHLGERDAHPLEGDDPLARHLWLRPRDR